MLGRIESGALVVRSVDGTFERRVDVADLRAISAVRLHPDASRVAITAVLPGGRAPDPTVGGTEGDLRLVVVDLATGARSTPYPRYAHDPAWLPDGDRIAFHTGRGVAVVSTSSGTALESERVGRFSWGPPAVSVSPSGSRVAFVRWKGDAQKLATFDLATAALRVSKWSAYRYAWWSDDELVIAPESGLLRLEVASDAKKVVERDARALLRALPELRAIDEAIQPGEHPARSTVSSPFVHAGRLYRIVWLWRGGRESRTAVCSTDLDGGAPRIDHLAPPQARISSYAILDGGGTIAIFGATYDPGSPTTATGEIALLAGRQSGPFPAGFGPLPRAPLPEPGFHALPG